MCERQLRFIPFQYFEICIEELSGKTENCFELAYESILAARITASILTFHDNLSSVFILFFPCIFSTLYFPKALLFFFTRHFMIPGFVRACQEHLEISEKPPSISESLVLFA